MFGADGRILQANDQYLEIFGWTLDEAGSFAVLDKNGTDGRAEFQMPAPVGGTAYAVYARALGTPVLLNYHSGEAPDHLRRSWVARAVLRQVGASGNWFNQFSAGSGHDAAGQV